MMGGIGQLMAGAAGGGTGFGGAVIIKVTLWLIASVILLVLGIHRLGIVREPVWLNAVSPERIAGFQAALSGAAENRGWSAFFFIGIMLGLLPF